MSPATMERNMKDLGWKAGGKETLNSLLDETAARAPAKTALVTERTSMTFSELRGNVLKAAAAFRGRGVKQGDCVAIVCRNGPEFIIAYFGLARLGAIVVPINFLVQKPDELRYMLADCAAVGVVTQKEFLKGLLAARQELPGLKSVWACDHADPAKAVEDFREFAAAGDAASLGEPSVSAGDTAAILYTSGTTGHPKGVMLSHANLVSNCDGAIKAMRLSDREVCLTILPMFHTFAWTANVLVPLRLGIKNVIASTIAPAKPWLKLMGRHGVTIFSAVPPIYSVLAREVRGLQGLVIRYWFFRKVKYCMSGAAPLNPDTARAFREAMGLPILEGYGLTETSPAATLNTLLRRREGSVGLPIDQVRVKIIGEDERELASGEEGEICIQGPNVMLGYHKRPEETKEAFTRDGWFKSGDIGVVDKDGFLFIRDRKKDMIIVKGLKVFSAQVEAVIASHPDVEEAAIVGIPEETGDELIKAFVVLKKGAATDKAALQRFCRERLDAYKRPRDIELVESLPKNALQKVLKRVLRQQEIDKRH